MSDDTKKAPAYEENGASDVKIFGQQENSEDAGREDSPILELVAQKANGNLYRAKQLGAILAAEVESNDDEFIFKSGLRQEEKSPSGKSLLQDEVDLQEELAFQSDAIPQENSIIVQRRLLLAFVVDYGLNTFCPNKVISEIAISFFYDTIKSDSPLIYEDIRETGAFSFYQLCVREGEKIEEAIGKTFAELVGHKGNAVYAQLGTALFLHFIDVVKSKISELKFAE